MTYIQWVTQYRIIKKEELRKDKLRMDIMKNVFKESASFISKELEFFSSFISLFSGDDKRMITEYLREKEKERIKKIDPEKEFKTEIDFFDEVMGDDLAYPESFELDGPIGKDENRTIRTVSKKSLGIQIKKGGE